MVKTPSPTMRLMTDFRYLMHKMVLKIRHNTKNVQEWKLVLAKLKVETAWTMAAHSCTTHTTHSSAHITHPEHARPTEKRLEYLVRIHFAFKKKNRKSVRVLNRSENVYNY